MNTNIKNVGIIGGGASGALCAILIKKHCNCNVTIYERQHTILKKLLKTGNGMCNITNQFIDWKMYNTNKIEYCLDSFNVNECIELFKELGLLIKKDSEGRFYPYSRKATSVYDCFLQNIQALGINVKCDCEINAIKVCDDFSLYTSNFDLFHVDYLVISTGGASSINFDIQSSYKMIEALGHHITSLNPSLVGFKVKEKIKNITGIRIRGQASLYVLDKVYQGFGEIQFKDDGVSGIVIMELSRFYDPNEECYLEIDLMNDYCEEDIKKLLLDFINNKKNLREALCAIFVNNLSDDLIKRSNNDIDKLVYIIKHYHLTISSTYGFDNSQVTNGGVSLNEISPFTFTSLLHPNLYFTGEVIDVNGTCGGYNLHFAWASSYLVSKDITKWLMNGENRK